MRKNYTFISSAKSGGERERERGPSRCHGVDQGLYLLYSQYAPRPREIHGWANLPANHGKPVEKESSRAKSRSPSPFSPPSKPSNSFRPNRNLIDFISWKYWSRIHQHVVLNRVYLYCYFLILSYPARYDTIRYDTSFVSFHSPLSCLERKLAPARLGFSN